MECPGCRTEVSEGQKFCPECGRSLRGVTDPTEPIDQQAPTADDAAPAPQPLPPPPVIAASPAETSTTEVPHVTAPPDAPTTDTPTADIPAADTPAADTPTADIPATTEMAAVPPPIAAEHGDGRTTDQMPLVLQPAIFDGSADIEEYPEHREPFGLTVLFAFAFFGAVAVLLVAVADIVDIRTSVPVDGIATGIRTLDTLGTNLAVAGFVGATVMAVGGLLGCFGFRWASGLAGGAGLALAGWAGLVLGLAELRVASAESITRQTTDLAFTLRITRDLGYWLLVAVVVVGVIVFLASLRSVSNAGRPPLNPWIAALGAVGGVVLAAGPLLPVGRAVFADNFSSPTETLDLPTIYFAGRLAQVGLIAFTTVVGLLLVRAWGLGLAAGGLAVAVWMWLSALVDLGSAPLGIAAGNFGATDSTPHAVTTVGMALTVLMVLVATVLAVVGHRRRMGRHAH